MKKTPLVLIVGVIVLVLIGAYTGYSFWERSAANNDLKVVQKELADYQNQVLQFENQKVTQAINAKQTINELKDDIVLWSRVIKKVRSTVPKLKGDTIVDILSYSASSGSTINMNAKTIPGSDDPYLRVADLIEGFDDEDVFKNAFVPSISAGLDDEGEEILTFMFSADYVDEDVAEIVKKEKEEVNESEEAEAVVR
ncbi:MAG: hypothetical protein O3B47_05575 [bacterium]|nr:hypothetical protein [bacterium]